MIREGNAGRIVPACAGNPNNLVVGWPFSEMLAGTLPLHHIEMETNPGARGKNPGCPGNLAGAGCCGLLAWLPGGSANDWNSLRRRCVMWAGWPVRALALRQSNRGVVRVIQESAEDLRSLQTGMLNWNIAAIIVGAYYGNTHRSVGSIIDEFR